jgi:tetratricopeptide (TPR) repeat protein
VAAIVLLIIVGAAGLTLQGPIRSLQGGVLDGQQNFAAAANEYSAAGDHIGLARTYNEWGEFLLKQGKYSEPDDPGQQARDGALAKFNFVLNPKNGFTNATDGTTLEQVSRAKEGVVNTVLAWGDAQLNKLNSQNQPDYQGAVDRFKLVLDHTDTYGSTNAFPRLHKEAAKAYYGLAQQQVAAGSDSGDCTDAVTTYHLLVMAYSDTTPGQQAATDLKKPQNIAGVVVSRQTGQPASNVKLFLSARWQLMNNSFSASNDYTTTSDASGNFTFANIAPDDVKYLISYIGTGGGENITVSGASGQPANVVVPLCGANAGTVIQF